MYVRTYVCQLPDVTLLALSKKNVFQAPASKGRTAPSERAGERAAAFGCETIICKAVLTLKRRVFFVHKRYLPVRADVYLRVFVTVLP